jgi:hypothetical protein
METIILLSLATATTSVTISYSKMFLWLRNYCDNTIVTKGLTHRTTLLTGGKQKRFFSGLVNCHYCLNHWIAAFFVIITPNSVEHAGYLVTWLAVTAVASLVSSLMIFAVWRE